MSFTNDEINQLKGLILGGNLDDAKQYFITTGPAFKRNELTTEERIITQSINAIVEKIKILSASVDGFNNRFTSIIGNEHTDDKDIWDSLDYNVIVTLKNILEDIEELKTFGVEIGDNKQKYEGIQKIKGFSTNGNPIEYIPEYNIVLTGITFSQNIFDINDKWYVSIKKNDSEVTHLVNGIFSKENLQHKYFDMFHYVSMGEMIVIEPKSDILDNKIFWFDLEYIELEN